MSLKEECGQLCPKHNSPCVVARATGAEAETSEVFTGKAYKFEGHPHLCLGGSTPHAWGVEQ